MQLGNKSQALLKEARDQITVALKAVSAACASRKLTEKECGELALALRVAASKLETISGRLFYAKGKRK